MRGCELAVLRSKNWSLRTVVEARLAPYCLSGSVRLKYHLLNCLLHYLLDSLESFESFAIMDAGWLSNLK